MQVIEQFLAGKAGDEAVNEDRIAVTADFVGLFDGATNRGGATLAGVPLGRFAAQTVAEGLAHLPADSDAYGAIAFLSDYLGAATQEHSARENRDTGEDWAAPSTAALIYSRARREIWRVSDSSFIVDGGPAQMRFFAQERTWCDLRRVWIQGQLVQGRSEAELIEHDGSWELLTPLIKSFKIFANNDHTMAHPFGFGVLDGRRVPERYIEVFDAAGAREVVFASDGYPEVFATLDETETALRHVLQQDPLMYRLHPQVKGMRKGWQSFDDRSYIRFTAEG